MKLVSYLYEGADQQKVTDAQILTCDELSKSSSCSTQQMLELFKKSQNAILEWDLLVDQNQLERGLKFISTLPKALQKIIRVSDPGVLFSLLEKFPSTKIQLNLEVGNHNLRALQTWVDYLGDRLDRVILSIELPKEKIKTYISSFPSVSFELLGLGRVLLFYTPRQLLSPHRQRVHNRPLEVKAKSEESAHKGFSVLESKHGTLMYNTKDFSVLPYLDELKKMGLAYIRVDHRPYQNEEIIPKIEDLILNFSKEKATEIQASWPVKTNVGFYKKNKSDVLFKKLKNSKLKEAAEDSVGEVLEYKRGKYTAFFLKEATLQKGDRFALYSPEGKYKETELEWLKDSQGNLKDSIQGPKLVLIPAFSGFGIRSQVILL